jgi:hypothetical protein
MNVFAHPDLNLILGTVTVFNKHAKAPLPCAGLQFELQPREAAAAPVVGPLSCPGDAVAPGGQIECGFAVQADAQAYASADAVFDDAMADAMAAVDDGPAGGVPFCDDDVPFGKHGRKHRTKPRPLHFKRPPPLFKKYAKMQRFSAPPPPKLELCADALAQAFGDDAWAMTFAKADACCRDRPDFYAVATAVVASKFGGAHVASAPPPAPAAPPQVVYVDRPVPVEKIVERIVEKPVEKVVTKVEYRDRVVTKEVPVEKIVEKPVERIVYKDKIVYNDRVVEKVVDRPYKVDNIIYQDRVVYRDVPTIVEKEKIVDRIVDRPVEKIVYKDRPVEVEKVVTKEVPVPVPVPVPVFVAAAHHKAIKGCGGPCIGGGASLAAAKAVSLKAGKGH